MFQINIFLSLFLLYVFVHLCVCANTYKMTSEKFCLHSAQLLWAVGVMVPGLGGMSEQQELLQVECKLETF